MARTILQVVLLILASSMIHSQTNKPSSRENSGLNNLENVDPPIYYYDDWDYYSDEIPDYAPLKFDDEELSTEKPQAKMEANEQDDTKSANKSKNTIPATDFRLFDVSNRKEKLPSGEKVPSRENLDLNAESHVQSADLPPKTSSILDKGSKDQKQTRGFEAEEGGQNQRIRPADQKQVVDDNLKGNGDSDTSPEQNLKPSEEDLPNLPNVKKNSKDDKNLVENQQEWVPSAFQDENFQGRSFDLFSVQDIRKISRRQQIESLRNTYQRPVLSVIGNPPNENRDTIIRQNLNTETGLPPQPFPHIQDIRTQTPTAEQQNNQNLQDSNPRTLSLQNQNVERKLSENLAKLNQNIEQQFLDKTTDVNQNTREKSTEDIRGYTQSTKPLPRRTSTLAKHSIQQKSTVPFRQYNGERPTTRTNINFGNQYGTSALIPERARNSQQTQSTLTTAVRQQTYRQTRPTKPTFSQHNPGRIFQGSFQNPLADGNPYSRDEFSTYPVSLNGNIQQVVTRNPFYPIQSIDRQPENFAPYQEPNTEDESLNSSPKYEAIPIRQHHRNAGNDPNIGAPPFQEQIPRRITNPRNNDFYLNPLNQRKTKFIRRKGRRNKESSNKNFGKRVYRIRNYRRPPAQEENLELLDKKSEIETRPLKQNDQRFSNGNLSAKPIPVQEDDSRVIPGHNPNNGPSITPSSEETDHNASRVTNQDNSSNPSLRQGQELDIEQDTFIRDKDIPLDTHENHPLSGIRSSEQRARNRPLDYRRQPPNLHSVIADNVDASSYQNLEISSERNQRLNHLYTQINNAELPILQPTKFEAGAYKPVLRRNPWYHVNQLPSYGSQDIDTESIVNPTDIPNNFVEKELGDQKIFKVNTKGTKVDTEMSDEKANKLLKNLKIFKMEPEHGKVTNVVRKKIRKGFRTKNRLQGAGLRRLMIIIRKKGEEILRKKLWLNSHMKLAKNHQRNKGYSIVLSKKDKQSKADVVRSIKNAVSKRRKLRNDKSKLKKVRSFSTSEI